MAKYEVIYSTLGVSRKEKITPNSPEITKLAGNKLRKIEGYVRTAKNSDGSETAYLHRRTVTFGFLTTSEAHPITVDGVEAASLPQQILGSSITYRKVNTA